MSKKNSEKPETHKSESSGSLLVISALALGLALTPVVVALTVEQGTREPIAPSLPTSLAVERQNAHETCQDAEQVLACLRIANGAYRGVDHRYIDRRLGIELYGEACEAGSLEACLSFARTSFANSNLVSAHEAFRAGEALSEHCNLGAVDACQLLNDWGMHLRRLCASIEDGSCPVAVEQGATMAAERRSTSGARGLSDELRCRGGDGDSCLQYADSIVSGFFGVEIYAEAVEAYRQACELGSAVACRSAGLAFLDGIGVQVNLSWANSLLSAGCARGDEIACNWVADEMLWLGDSVDNWEEKFLFYADACHLGNEAACISLVAGHEIGAQIPQSRAFGQFCRAYDEPLCGDQDTLQGHPRTVRAYSEACDMGIREGCSALADLYADGNGVPRNPVRACDLGGVPEVCVEASERYLGAGDTDRALDMLERGCAQGGPDACLTAASIVAAREGYEPSQEYFLQAACDLGGSEGCISYGVIRVGELGAGGTAQELTEIFGYFERACELGSGSGCFAAARFLQEVSFDGSIDPTAEELFEASCDAHYLPGCLLMEQTAARRLVGFSRNRVGAPDGYGEACLIFSRSTEDCLSIATAREADDWALALDLHESACYLGATTGCLNAGRLRIEYADWYEGQIGGMHFLAVACASGAGEACSELVESLELSPDQSAWLDEILVDFRVGSEFPQTDFRGLSREHVVQFVEDNCSSLIGDFYYQTSSIRTPTRFLPVRYWTMIDLENRSMRLDQVNEFFEESEYGEITSQISLDNVTFEGHENSGAHSSSAEQLYEKDIALRCRNDMPCVLTTAFTSELDTDPYAPSIWRTEATLTCRRAEEVFYALELLTNRVN